MQQKDDTAIVTVNLTTDGHTPTGETRDIIIDEHHSHLFSDRSLFVPTPSGALIIKRDCNGNIIKRLGNKSTGVSLSGYLHGKTHMFRKKVTDTEDYRAEAFKPNSGRPKAIGVYSSPDASKPSRILFESEEAAYKQSPGVQTKEQKQHQTSIKKLERMRDRVKAEPKGAIVECPECGEKFEKTHPVMAFCSSYSRRGPNNKMCKNTFNSRLTLMRSKQTPSVIAKPQLELNLKDTTKQPVVATQTPTEQKVISKPVTSGQSDRSIQVTEPGGRRISFPLDTPPEIIKLLLS
jgi:hypothetical protein